MKSLAEVIAAGRKRPHVDVSTTFNEHEFKSCPAIQPEHLTPLCPETFCFDDPKLLEHLDTHGFVVVINILCQDEIQDGFDLLWEFLNCKASMNRTDPSTWSDDNFRRVGSAMNGIIGGGGVGQSKFQWFMRSRPKVKSVFEQIYSTSDLITSFDGCCIFRPWQHPDKLSARTSSGWFHVDQGRTLHGRHCVQALIALTDTDESTGGFCCIPGSHLLHSEFIESAKDDSNYFKLPGESPVLQKKQTLLRCNAGEETRSL
jgi:hypothetical protein